MMTFIKMRKGVNFRHSHFHSFPQFRGRPLAPPFPFSELLSNMGTVERFVLSLFAKIKNGAPKGQVSLSLRIPRLQIIMIIY